jgi:hypothetical protein
MANTDKNLVITPNIGSSSADPQMVFSAANASVTAQTITLRSYPSGTGAVLSFEGSSGQIFSLSNSLTGTLFAASDASGIPSIEVLDTGQVKLAQYSGNVGIGTGSASYKLDVAGSFRTTTTANVAGVLYATAGVASSSTTTGALQVTGGVGITGALNVGSTLAVTGSTTLTGTVTSNLIFTDNTYDIGASGATRPRNLYLAGAATLGTALAIASGGTNSTATPTNGGVGYGTGTAHAYTAVGTAGQKLVSAAAAAPVWTTVGGTNFFTSGTSATWTMPTGASVVKITVQGPGGNGATPATQRATGGSGGGTAIKWLNLAPGTTVTYTVGTASGTASTATVGGVTYTGNSGANGTASAYGATNTAGPTGGTGTNGDINIQGGEGGSSQGGSTVATANYSGAGGDSEFGVGGNSIYNCSAVTAGVTGRGYGAGGAGGSVTGAGASGTGGFVLFEWV